MLLPQAWQAADLLKERYKLDVAVVNLPWLSRVSPEWLRDTVAGRRAVFTLDNHLIGGGQGRMLAAAVAKLGLAKPPRVHLLGVKDIPACGQNDEVLRAHGLDAHSLAEFVAEAMQLQVA